MRSIVLLLAMVSSVAAAHVPEHSIFDPWSDIEQRIVEFHEAPTRAQARQVFRHRDRPQWDGVHPELRIKLESIYAQMHAEGFDIRLAEGFRSHERQAQLLASAKGVTQVGPGRSCHNYGYAADSVVFKRGRPSWDLKDTDVSRGYARYGELAQAAGLRWGGAWKGFQDMPHVEMTGDCRLAIRARDASEIEFQRMLVQWEARRAQFALNAQRQWVFVDPSWLDTPFRCVDEDCTDVMQGTWMHAHLTSPPEQEVVEPSECTPPTPWQRFKGLWA